jgi:hypothetical protein
VEDLRIMIGQQIALPHLLPRALALLEADPLAEGDLFPGDLLANVLRIDGQYWRENDEQRHRLRDIVGRMACPPQELEDLIAEFP